jgi:transposase
MTESKIVAFDLAKRIVQGCVIDASGAIVEEGRLGPEAALAFAGRHPGATVALEACGGSHQWGRELQRRGHRVLLLPAQRVKSYGDPACKDDRRDARAIAEAASRPYLRPVPVKSEPQQALQSLDRTAALLARQRTQTVNALHGHLAEFGILLPKGPHLLKRRFPELETSARWRELPEELRFAAGELFAAFLGLEERLKVFRTRLARAAKASRLGRLLLEVPGIGAMTAVCLEAAVGDDPGRFSDGRHFAAWLGLTPRLAASGERTQLARITKRGCSRLRSLLAVCAQAMLRQYKAGRHHDALACWARRLLARKRWNVAVVALANKLARIDWKVMASGSPYQARTT